MYECSLGATSYVAVDSVAVAATGVVGVVVFWACLALMLALIGVLCMHGHARWSARRKGRTAVQHLVSLHAHSPKMAVYGALQQHEGGGSGQPAVAQDELL